MIANSWFNVSIFQNVESWNCLLKRCLLPLFDEQLESMINEYYLRVSFLRGHHIVIHVNSPTSSFEIVKAAITGAVSEFILHNPSKDAGGNPTGFFMDYPNDSVYVGIHHLHPEKLGNFNPGQIHSILKSASKLIISAFDAEPIDKEGLWTLSLYAQIITLKRLFLENGPSLMAIKGLLKSILLHMPLNKQIEIDRKSTRLIQANFGNFRSIHSEAWLERDAPDWLTKWGDSITELRNKSSLSLDFQFISYMLLEHVGLSVEVDFPINCNVIYYSLLQNT